MAPDARPMRISVIETGAWGTALAIATTRRHRVLLWARDAAQARRMAAERRNDRYLPQAAWPDALGITSDHAAALAHAEGGLLIVATPMAALREQLADLPADACVSSNVQIGVGGSDVLDRGADGVDVTYADDAPAPAGRPKLHIDADVGMGVIEVVREGYLRDQFTHEFRNGQKVANGLKDFDGGTKCA